jgi:hypothetical protein
MIFLNKYKYYFAFLIITILAFWQIVFFVHPPKYDMIDCYLPWRFHVGECLQSGKFPFWNPYQDLGYPIHADPSSGSWYPIVWAIGYFFGYNVYTIGMEMWLHVFIAAIGFFKLAKTLKLNQQTAFIASIAYMLCGIFIGNAQHLTYAISACWIPFILNYYLKLSNEVNFGNAFKAAFFMFLLITGGYPAFSIILFYLLLTFFTYNFIQLLKKKEHKKTTSFLIRNALFFIITILLSAGILISIYEVTPYLSRTNGFGIERAFFSPFSPQSMLSFIYPFAVIKETAFFDTDLSMSNAYFGIFMFLFFILSIFIKKSIEFKIFLGFAVFALLASFGSYLPIRGFLFNYVPLMNLFRFPSVFRYFAILGFLLSGAYWLNNYLANFEKQKELLKRGLIIFIGIVILTLLILIFTSCVNIPNFINNYLFIVSEKTTIETHLVFQSIIHLILLSLFLYLLLTTKNIKRLVLYLTLIISVDMIVSAQLNNPYTAHYSEFSAKEANNHFNKFPKGFPQLPDIAIKDVNTNEMYFGPFWKNVNIIQKQISSEGFNSFAFTGHEQFRDNTPKLYQEIIKNKIVFLSNEIHPYSELKDSTYSAKSLYFSQEEFEIISKNELESCIGDTVYLKHFAPDSFTVIANTKIQQVLTLLQNNYKGWKAFINNKEYPIFTSNHSLISIILPAGKNTIYFVYQNNSVVIAKWISIFTMILALVLILLEKRKLKQQYNNE